MAFAGVVGLASTVDGCHTVGSADMSWTTCLSACAPEAHIAKGYLEHRGVPCLLVADGPAVYPVPTFGMRVLVPEVWFPIARKLLEGGSPRPHRRSPRHLKRVS